MGLPIPHVGFIPGGNEKTEQAGLFPTNLFYVLRYNNQRTVKKHIVIQRAQPEESPI